MKKILGGQTYNTATSHRIAQLVVKKGSETITSNLYATRGRALFIHEHRVWTYWNEDTSEPEWNSDDRILPISWEDAQRWIGQENMEILTDAPFFELPPEAVSEVSPGATIYLRLPQSLKAQIEAAAKASGTSINNYTMRCLERCLTSEANQRCQSSSEVETSAAPTLAPSPRKS